MPSFVPDDSYRQPSPSYSHDNDAYTLRLEQEKAIRDANQAKFDKALDRADMNIIQTWRTKQIKKHGIIEALGATPDTWGDYYPRLLQIDEDNYKDDTHGKLTPKETFGFFITLSPEPETVIPLQLEEVATRITKAKGCLEYMFVIEQSGTGSPHPVGYHPHVHILVKLNKDNQGGEPRRFYNEIKRKCAKFKTKSEAFLQIKAVSKKNYPKKEEYIRGEKIDPSKLHLVKLDIEWREKNKIPHIFQSDLRPPLAEI